MAENGVAVDKERVGELLEQYGASIPSGWLAQAMMSAVIPLEHLPAEFVEAHPMASFLQEVAAEHPGTHAGIINWRALVEMLEQEVAGG